MKLGGDIVEPSSVARATKTSDEALMAQMREDNKEALALLFRRYARLVRGERNRRKAKGPKEPISERTNQCHKGIHAFGPHG